MPEILRAGGVQYNWNSTLSRVDGSPWRGIIKVDWGEKLEVETVYSQTGDGRPLGPTDGQYSVDGLTITFLQEYADQFTDYLAFLSPGFPSRGLPGNFGQTFFTYQLQTSEPLFVPGKPIILIADTCKIISHKATVEKGTGANAVEFGLWSRGLEINGKTLYTQALPSF